MASSRSRIRPSPGSGVSILSMLLFLYDSYPMFSFSASYLLGKTSWIRLREGSMGQVKKYNCYPRTIFSHMNTVKANLDGLLSRKLPRPNLRNEWGKVLSLLFQHPLLDCQFSDLSVPETLLWLALTDYFDYYRTSRLAAFYASRLSLLGWCLS